MKSLRKANDNLKRQLKDLTTDFQIFKNKMAEKNDATRASLRLKMMFNTSVMVMMPLCSPKRIW